MSYPIIEQYGEFFEATGDQTASAILVLADVIAHKTIINPASAENLGHELGCLLNNVPLRASVEVAGDITVTIDS